MIEYHKIQSIFKRDERTHKFIENEWSLPEFDYLKNNEWVYTEKIDGTNIRIGWNGFDMEIGGRTANAQIPTFLYQRLIELFTKEKLESTIPVGDDVLDAMLCGEGYGAKIQKGGGNYIPGGVGFILFDVKIGEWWLKREDVADIAQSLGINVVPEVGRGTIGDAILEVKNGFTSTFGNFMAEGMVLRPAVELKTRGGHRIITKLKNRDF